MFNIKKVKIVVFVPENYKDIIINAMCLSGAGIINNYSYCTSSTKTVGTFMPNEKANPFIGKQNKIEFVNEIKLEAICDKNKVLEAIKNIRKNHPYEEPEIDIIPLLSEEDFIE